MRLVTTSQDSCGKPRYGMRVPARRSGPDQSPDRRSGRHAGAVYGRPLDRRVTTRDADAASLYARKTAFIRVCQPGPWARNHPSTSGSTRKEIDSFADCAFSPRRTIPRTMCAGSASGWSRPVLMSRSRCASTRAQLFRAELSFRRGVTDRPPPPRRAPAERVTLSGGAKRRPLNSEVRRPYKRPRRSLTHS